ncbi:Dolichyl-diphosphooligosaccharide-protein glycosyltransferase subunit dad1 [Teratosphaeriaceae sp. CCFEE 6253]|nr:Dolichyl-diphosphooligosaccharide-protein glycosyltransferase subunit dad1 [Teratosphaeriaceae sp. CCFEE 6253]
MSDSRPRRAPFTTRVRPNNPWRRRTVHGRKAHVSSSNARFSCRTSRQYALDCAISPFAVDRLSQSLENVLQNINKLNRSLEGVIALAKPDQVGNEFSQVEGLWSQFENVMAKEPQKNEGADVKEGAADGDLQR